MKKIFLLCAVCASMIACEKEPVGALSGKFTIDAAGNQVVFAQGNLQYQPSTGKWKFATNQFDTIGIGNANIAANYEGWIDLFGWGTGNHPTDTSTNAGNYATFTDWGVNKISNGGNKANVWRSLTKEEIDYICYARANAANLRGQATVDGVYGFIFLPDQWTGSNFVPMPDDATTNVYTFSQWKQMEKEGAVFLPAAGGRIGQKTITVGSWGLYWLSTAYDDTQAHDIDFMIKGQDIDKHYRHYAFAVRLVQSVKKK